MNRNCLVYDSSYRDCAVVLLLTLLSAQVSCSFLVNTPVFW